MLVNFYRKWELNLKRDRPMACFFFYRKDIYAVFSCGSRVHNLFTAAWAKVPNIGYAGHTRFVCGIVLKIHDANYFAPISSNTKKFRTSFAYGIYPFDCTIVVYVPGHRVCFVGIEFWTDQKNGWKILEIVGNQA